MFLGGTALPKSDPARLISQEPIKGFSLWARVKKEPSNTDTAINKVTLFLFIKNYP